jgi:class 3 adenylate cyclase/pimeloyl-ACP methyl ester carboxylesterase
VLVDAAIQPIRGYARSGDVHIAYQVLGDGPIDMVHVLPFGIPVEVGWELPQIARWWSLIGSFTRSVIFDQRGVGSSDRTVTAPTIEDQMADLEAVVEAVGANQFVLAAYSQASPAGIVYAARNADRVKRLVLYAATARVMWAADYPAGRTRHEARQWVSKLAAGWGNGGTLDQNQPSVAEDSGVREWYARAERTLGSPTMAAKMSQALGLVDVREEAKSLRVPALVIHRTDDPAIPVGQGRWLAEHIPNARWVELDGVDHALYFGDMSLAIQEIQGWVTGKRPVHRGDRTLSTLLFTDIANSTQAALELGDVDWRNVLARHHAEVRRELLHQGGVELNAAGDGFLAEFPTATAAIAAARALRRCIAKLGLDVRVGIHTTECERSGHEVSGVGVHVAARICALASPGEILVSGTVADVLLGSEVALDARGEHRLRGVPGSWRVCAVAAERRRRARDADIAAQALP